MIILFFLICCPFIKVVGSTQLCDVTPHFADALVVVRYLRKETADIEKGLTSFTINYGYLINPAH